MTFGGLKKKKELDHFFVVIPVHSMVILIIDLLKSGQMWTSVIL